MAGISADLDLGSIEIMAGLKAELSKSNDLHERDQKWRARELARSRVPSSVRQFVSATIPTPTVRVGMSFGGPDPGFYWLLRRLVIGGVNWKTAAAGTAEIYVSALGAGQGQAAVGPIVNGLGLTDMVDQAAALPDKAYYSNQQIIIQENENLIVLIDGGTAGQQYVAAAQCEIWRTIASPSVFDA